MIAADHLLNTIVAVQRRQVTDDGMGGQQVTWDAIGEQPARISQPTDEELWVAAREHRDLTHRVYLTAGADVFRGDRIVTAAGIVMGVEAVVQPSEPAYLRAECSYGQAGF
jgi:head-tail adaptor